MCTSQRCQPASSASLTIFDIPLKMSCFFDDLSIPTRASVTSCARVEKRLWQDRLIGTERSPSGAVIGQREAYAACLSKQEVSTRRCVTEMLATTRRWRSLSRQCCSGALSTLARQRLDLNTWSMKTHYTCASQLNHCKTPIDPSTAARQSSEDRLDAALLTCHTRRRMQKCNGERSSRRGKRETKSTGWETSACAM